MVFNVLLSARWFLPTPLLHFLNGERVRCPLVRTYQQVIHRFIHRFYFTWYYSDTYYKETKKKHVSIYED